MTLPKSWSEKINDECKNRSEIWQVAYETASELWAERAHRLYEALESVTKMITIKPDKDWNITRVGRMQIEIARNTLAEFDKSLELE